MEIFWTWAALGTENKASCLCCKQRIKQNVNHPQLSLMTSTCVLILTVSISYTEKKSVWGEDLLFTHSCQSQAALRSNKTNSKICGQKSITLARVRERKVAKFEPCYWGDVYVWQMFCVCSHMNKAVYATTHFQFVLKFWNWSNYDIFHYLTFKQLQFDFELWLFTAAICLLTLQISHRFHSLCSEN